MATALDVDWEPPSPVDVLVWPEPGGTGWNYTSLDNWPAGDCHWTAHLTNALHDAGWAVVQRRKGKRRTQP